MAEEQTPIGSHGAAGSVRAYYVTAAALVDHR
jgi:hypothetical protein